MTFLACEGHFGFYSNIYCFPYSRVPEHSWSHFSCSCPQKVSDIFIPEINGRILFFFSKIKRSFRASEKCGSFRNCDTGLRILFYSIGTCVCSWLPPECYSKIPLLKTQYTEVTGHGEFKAVLALKHHPHGLAFTAPEGAVHFIGREKTSSRSCTAGNLWTQWQPVWQDALIGDRVAWIFFRTALWLYLRPYSTRVPMSGAVN